jgi:hypothetical protein
MDLKFFKELRSILHHRYLGGFEKAQEFSVLVGMNAVFFAFLYLMTYGFCYVSIPKFH